MTTITTLLQRLVLYSALLLYTVPSQASSVTDNHDIILLLPCSKEGDEFSLVVTNPTSTPIDIYWKDYQCNSDNFYARAEPSSSYTQQTVSTHVWIAANSSTGAAIDSWIAGGQKHFNSDATEWKIGSGFQGSKQSQSTQGLVESDETSALSTGTIIGIAIAAAILLALLPIIIFYYKRKQSTKKQDQSPNPDDGNPQLLPYVQSVNSDGTYQVVPPYSPPQSSISQGEFSVIHEHHAQQPDEIPLYIGETVTLMETFSDGWCRVYSQYSGQYGMVPVGCLEGRQAVATLSRGASRKIEEPLA